MLTIQCVFCAVSFQKKNMSGNPRFCSRSCYSRHWRRKQNPERYADRHCEQCSVVFTPKRGWNDVCCSAECQDVYSKAKLANLYQDNKERLNEYRNEWAKNNRDKQDSYAALSKSKRPEHYAELRRTTENRRRARKLSSGGSHSVEQWVALVLQTGEKCLRCKVPGTFRSLTKDHVVPISLGGSDDISNIQPLCFSCNSWKHARYIDYREVAA